MPAKYLLSILIGAAVLISFIVWLSWDSFTTEPELPVYALFNTSFGYGEKLLIRRTSPDGDLLLKVLNRDEVVHYNIAEKVISRAAKADWDQATGPLTICGESGGTLEEDGYGRFNARGKHAMANAYSSDQTKMAVLSGYGPARRGPNFFFLGGGYIVYGTRYFELKENTPPFTTVSKIYRVSDRVSEALCSTADDRLVVIYNYSGLAFSVVNFGPLPSEQPAAPGAAVPTSPKPDLCALTGRFTDRGVDQDGDGIYEKIAIEIETETTVPGSYYIDIGLESKDGKLLGGFAYAELKGGIENTTIFIDTRELFDKGINGVFNVRYIGLDTGNHESLQMLKDIGVTKEYKLTQFSRPEIILTGKNTMTPVDKDRNGKYEGIEVEIGVDALTAGRYNYEVDLYNTPDDAAEPVEIAMSGTAVKKGKGTIKCYFNGKKIIARGAGKLQVILRSLYLPYSKRSAYLESTVVGTLQLSADQFE